MNLQESIKTVAEIAVEEKNFYIAGIMYTLSGAMSENKLDILQKLLPPQELKRITEILIDE